MTDPVERRGPGRPSVATERRRQVLDAFIALIAERGLSTVTLDDVATAAGVQRTVIRHYVGNRADLVHAAAEHLIDQYVASVRGSIGPEPTLPRLVEHLFSRAWSTSRATEDRAFDELSREASRDDTTRARLRGAYEQFVQALAEAIGRDHPSVRPGAAREAAYAIVCLAEQNAVLQALGMPKRYARSAKALALRLAEPEADAAAEPIRG